MNLDDIKSVPIKDLKVSDEVNIYHCNKDYIDKIEAMKIISIRGTNIQCELLYPENGERSVVWYDLDFAPGGQAFFYLYHIRYRL